MRLPNNVELQRGSIIVRVRIERVRPYDKGCIGEASLAFCRVGDRRGDDCDRGPSMRKNGKFVRIQ
jgi:hypothetical protein